MQCQRKVAGVDVPVVMGRSVSDKRGVHTNGAHRRRKKSVREKAGLKTDSNSVYSSGVNYKQRRVEDQLRLEASQKLSEGSLSFLKAEGLDIPEHLQSGTKALVLKNGMVITDRDKTDPERPLPEKESTVVHETFRKLPEKGISCGGKGARGRGSKITIRDACQPVSRGVPRLSTPESKLVKVPDSVREKEDKKFRDAMNEWNEIKKLALEMSN